MNQRIILAIMAFLGVAIVFTMRACFSIVLTEMVVPIEKTEKRNTSTICAGTIPATANRTMDSEFGHSTGTKYNWTQEQQGWILSSYFAGYSIGHIPAALLSHKISAKWMLSLSVIVPCISSAATPFVLAYGRLDVLIAVRVLMGLFGGVLFPAVTTLLSSWIPSKERASIGTFVLGGGQVGNIFGFYTSGLLLTFFTWPVIFYLWSIISIIWTIVFVLLCYNDPASHPFITKMEREYLKSEIGQLSRSSELPPIPWKQIFTSIPVIALVIAQIGNDCLYATIFTYLPKYMKEVIGFTPHETGLYTSLSCLSMWISSIAFGFLCDYLIDRRYLKTVHARKFFAGFSGIIPPILLIVATFTECNRIAFVILIILTAGFLGGYYPGMRINTLDLTPNYAGALLAYTNGIGSNGSFIFPGIIGNIITDSTIEQWRTVFKILLVLSLVRTAIYSIWASAKVQPWNNPVTHDPVESHKLTDTTKNGTKTHAFDKLKGETHSLIKTNSTFR